MITFTIFKELMVPVCSQELDYLEEQNFYHQFKKETREALFSNIMESLQKEQQTAN